MEKYVFNVKYKNGDKLDCIVLEGESPNQILNELKDAESVTTCNGHYINLDDVRYIKFDDTLENKKIQAEELKKILRPLIDAYKNAFKNSLSS